MGFNSILTTDGRGSARMGEDFYANFTNGREFFWEECAVQGRKGPTRTKGTKGTKGDRLMAEARGGVDLTILDNYLGALEWCWG